MANRLLERIAVYGSHVLAILLPGRSPRVFKLEGTEPAQMTGWLQSDFESIIELGTNQLARQRSDLEAIRGRAQFALTMNIVLFGSGAVFLPSISGSLASFLVWCLGMTGLLLSMLGSAGVLVARKDLGIVDTVNMSHQDADNLSVLAIAVVSSIRQGEVSVATNITVFRDSVAIGLYGFLIACAAWMLAIQ